MKRQKNCVRKVKDTKNVTHTIPTWSREINVIKCRMFECLHIFVRCELLATFDCEFCALSKIRLFRSACEENQTVEQIDTNAYIGITSIHSATYIYICVLVGNDFFRIQ